jgi:hypothetical protein
MNRTTAVILAAFVLTLGACKKQNETNVNEETSPAAMPAPAPAPAAAPESAATMSPATTSAAETTNGAMAPGMNMGTDTGKAATKEKKAKKM